MVAGTAFEFDFQQYTATRRTLVETRLREFLSPDDPKLLWESMRYSVLSGGKRIRALLCIASAEAVLEAAGSQLDACEYVLPCACAIELIHAMSLIHDDLPVMDNDDYRRGKPTNHKVYGEAMALLAGDALLAMASEILITKSSVEIDPYILLNVAAELTRASGAAGMVGGQVADMLSTGQIVYPADTTSDGSAITNCSSEIESYLADKSDELDMIHKRKTGALIEFAAWSGARLVGGTQQQLKLLGFYGETLGLAFQVADDLLDVTGDIKTLGKTPGKDEASGKLTYVKVHGLEKSRQTLAELEQQGKEALRQLELSPKASAPLSYLLEFAIRRSN
jgi:geranylgeranyl diphosphate synthase, type II